MARNPGAARAADVRWHRHVLLEHVWSYRYRLRGKLGDHRVSRPAIDRHERAIFLRDHQRRSCGVQSAADIAARWGSRVHPPDRQGLWAVRAANHEGVPVRKPGLLRSSDHFCLRERHPDSRSRSSLTKNPPGSPEDFFIRRTFPLCASSRTDVA